ncbi:Intraflagellar transport protein 80 -like protein [Trichinella papuae]|uniref:Intraflagellar transport protein 80-like protein n=1 Tax=Trichinella papuae TaxID=268474 RepID=A0A0V1N496_9BILA|nr:Intraflagellar transport protein 80 -like protein [Trichinella papuae]
MDQNGKNREKNCHGILRPFAVGFEMSHNAADRSPSHTIALLKTRYGIPSYNLKTTVYRAASCRGNAQRDTSEAEQMRLEIVRKKELHTTNGINAIDWSLTKFADELYHCGDDCQLRLWRVVENHSSTIATLSESWHPITLRSCPATKHANKSTTVSQAFLLATAEGKIAVISKSGRVEKIVNAHNGAVLSAEWSSDGISIVTCGEDGNVKLWSRNGVLRLHLAKVDQAVHCVRWSPDNSRVVFSFGDKLQINWVKATDKLPFKWHANQGPVLAVDWSPANNWIVWNEFGKALYVTVGFEAPICSIVWSPDGRWIAAGSNEVILLYHQSGWLATLEIIPDAEVSTLCWSSDGTLLAASCSDGQIICASLLGNIRTWEHLEAKHLEKCTIEVKNFQDGSVERLDATDFIGHFDLGWEHLIVVDPKKCYIYRSKNWNTPIIMDLKHSVLAIAMTYRLFLLTDGHTFYIYTYEGRHQNTIYPDTSQSIFFCHSTDRLALSWDTLSVCNSFNRRRIYLFDIESEKLMENGLIEHHSEISEITLDQVNIKNDRTLAFLDVNGDAFIIKVDNLRNKQCPKKIGQLLQSIRFGDAFNTLLGVQNENLLLWCHPTAAFFDTNLCEKCLIQIERRDIGKNAKIIKFFNSHTILRRTDGCQIFCALPIFPFALLKFCQACQWDRALRLCNQLETDELWATLAVESTLKKKLDVAVIAYAKLNEVEKVSFINNILSNPTQDWLNEAHTTLLFGDVTKAEQMLLQKRSFLNAIMLNVHLNRWPRALDIALKNKVYVDVVAGLRQKYLEEENKPETINSFLQLEDTVNVDLADIQKKISMAEI